jgi:hypothetical protein
MTAVKVNEIDGCHQRNGVISFLIVLLLWKNGVTLFLTE